MATPYCTDCQRPMEGGFLLDHTHGGRTPVKWVDGRPEKSFWEGLKLKGKRQLTVYAWRCTGCSQVRLYAPEG